MSTTEATIQQESTKASPVENLGEWIAEREKTRAAEDVKAEPEFQPEESAEPPAAPAEPAPTPEEPKKGSWRTTVLDDIPDKYLQGRTGEQFYDSYRAAVTEMQEAQRQRNEALREVDRLRRTSEVPRETAPAQPQREAIPNPTNDPELEEINRRIFEEGAAGLAAFKEKVRKELKEEIKEEGRALWHEEHQKQTQLDAEEMLRRESIQANEIARQEIVKAYGVDDERAYYLIKSTWPLMQDAERQYGRDIWRNPENYRLIVEHLYGKPPEKQTAEPPAAPTAAPESPAPAIPNPPGSRKPAAPPQTPVSRAASAISREEEAARKELASRIREEGIPIGDRFHQQASQRKGVSRG